MWGLLSFLCLLFMINIQRAEQALVTDDAGDHVYVEEPKDFWKLIFTTYYNLKGLKNETTDKLVEGFFEHEFRAYPKELYPAFEKIFKHISKSNDRIWNLYESILYLYHNVAAADRIYETMLSRLALGKLPRESREVETDVSVPLDESSKAEFDNLKHRSGVLFEGEPISDWEEQPCIDECGIPPLQVGSFRAIPGVHFPNYEEIPITSFTCAEKHIPGFYADLETGCQVFHVCYSHRRESFLCPIGTIFNQAILACDYWYSSNCSLAPLYFSSGLFTDEHVKDGTESFVDHLLGQYDLPDITSTTGQPDSPKRPEKPKSPKIKITLPNIDWTLMIKFLPIKSKITECPDFCETTTAHPIKSTTTPSISESTMSTSTRPTVTSTSTVKPKKDEYDEKTTKSKILLDIVKAVELLTKDAEGFLNKMLEEKRKHHDKPMKRPKVVPHFPTEKPKPVPEINQRFVVKPVKIEHFPRPKISHSKKLKPSKQILKSKDHFRKKVPAKLVLDGMKAIAHLFD